jgi:putative ABC transport system substrate-binding protein
LEKVNDVEARALGLQPQTLNVKGPNPDLEGAFAAMTNERAEALLILDQPATIAHQKRIAELAATHRLPTIFPGGWGSANAGGLIAYGTSFLDTLPGTARYVDKILKGAKPADLPIEVITRGELVFNLKTALAIGVTIPPELLKRATNVIE